MKILLDKDVSLYRKLIDNANVIINAFDAKGNILIWNKASEEITGYKNQDVIGNKKIMELLYPDADYRKEALKSIGSAFKENYKNVELVMITKYGEKKRISWSAVVMKDKAGKIIGSFAIGIDVTIKNLVKERERESFKALLKSVRYHEDVKQQYEELIKKLKEEVNTLCQELSKPQRY
jgi:two-component system, sporulation sensor kinase E